MPELKTMSNENYLEHFVRIKQCLEKLREAYIPLSYELLSETLTSYDLFLIPSVDRSMRLVDGFLPLMESRNLTCVGALLRLQIDSCLRAYALFIAEDREALVEGYIKGKRIDSFKDDEGKRMLDRRLKERLSSHFPEIAPAYDSTSGYIHFSEKAFYSIVRTAGDYIIEMGIGTTLPEDVNSLLIEAAEAFARFVTIHQQIIKSYAQGKHECFYEGNWGIN